MKIIKTGKETLIAENLIVLKWVADYIGRATIIGAVTLLLGSSLRQTFRIVALSLMLFGCLELFIVGEKTGQ